MEYPARGAFPPFSHLHIGVKFPTIFGAKIGKCNIFLRPKEVLLKVTLQELVCF